MQTTPINPIVNLMPLAIIFMIFYFLVLRPQKISQQEHRKMIDNLSKNDEVVTTGGIHGKIINVKEKTYVVRVDENVKIEIDKNCIALLKKKEKE